MFAETASTVKKQRTKTPDLFGSPLQPVTGWQRDAVLHKLRGKGHEITLRGRGVCTLYISEDAERAVLARCTRTSNGNKRWHFTRFGRLTRTEIAFIHTLHP